MRTFACAMVGAAVLAACSTETAPQEELTTATSTSTASTTAAPASSVQAAAAATTAPPVRGNPTGMLAGDAEPAAVGGSGVVIAQQGRFRQPSETYGGSVPILLRNNGSSPAVRIEASASATATNGEKVTAEDWGFTPNSVAPGGFAIGFVIFDEGVALPPGSQLQLSLKKAADGVIDIRHDLHVTGWTRRATRPGETEVVGTLRNPTTKTLSGIRLNVACFDAAGSILYVTTSQSIEKEHVPANGRLDFAVDLGSEPCPKLLLGAAGYEP